MEIEINEENIGKRLDVFLSEFDKKLSRSQWQKRIKAGEVLVAQKRRLPHYFLRKGDAILIDNKQSAINGVIGKTGWQDKNNLISNNIKVVFESDDYIVVNKPAGLAVHPSEKQKDGTLVDWLIKKYPEISSVGDDAMRPGIVHRLDREVSGLMVVARNKTMFDFLKIQFGERKIKKEYMALVHGRMKQDDGEIKLPLARSKKRGIFIGVSDFLSVFRKTKSAVTRYEVVDKFINFALLKINILTGRTHQIRAHMRSIGHAIVGDCLYATDDLKKKKRVVDLGRIWLYASKLGFFNLKHEWQEFKCSIPQELSDFLSQLKIKK